jgi:nucleoside-diphosphate-sugar epimerase
MRLLLVGHGYLGTAIARTFRTAGWAVDAVSLSGGERSLACDVADVDAVAALAKAVPRPDVIVHCAASGRGGAAAYQRVYVNGVRNLADRFPNVHLLFTSSTSVYGQIDGSEVTEESRTEPNRETSQLLRAAEAQVLAAGGTAARLAGIYGPHRSVILRKFLAGEAVVEEDGRRYLNQIHRDDAARAILHLTGLPGGIFNVCDSTPLSQLECYQRLSVIFGKPLPPSGPRDLDRKRGWTHKRVSNAKLLATGWQPQFPSFLDAVAEISAAGET